MAQGPHRDLSVGCIDAKRPPRGAVFSCEQADGADQAQPGYVIGMKSGISWLSVFFTLQTK